MSLAPSPLRPRRTLRAALLGAVAAIAIGAAVVETGAFAPSFAVADTQQPSAGPASFADVVDRVKSSVVSVKVKMADAADAESDFAEPCRTSRPAARSTASSSSSACPTTRTRATGRRRAVSVT